MNQMSEVHKDKKQFIEKSLSKVLTEATQGQVVSLSYNIIDNAEIVTITFKNGYTKQARINGDSKWYSIIDIMKVIGY